MVLWHEFKFEKGVAYARVRPDVRGRFASVVDGDWISLGIVTKGIAVPWVIANGTATGKTRKAVAEAALNQMLDAATQTIIGQTPRPRWGLRFRGDKVFKPRPLGGLALTPDQAEAVYNVLCCCCGADPRERQSFTYHHTDAKYPSTEYRFGGFLGFGGKFRNTSDHIYVDCYKEEETPENRYMIARANADLAELYLAWWGAQ